MQRVNARKFVPVASWILIILGLKSHRYVPLVAYFPKVGLCDLVPNSMSHSIAARQRGLLFDERRDRLFTVGALTKQSWDILLLTHRRSQSQSQSYFTTGDLPSISSSWRQSPWDSRPEFKKNTCFHSPYVTSSLTRGGSVVCYCCWPSPAQSFSGPSPVGLVTTFFSLKFMSPPTWRARSPYLHPQDQGGPVIPPRTGFPFRRLLRLAGLRWRYSTPSQKETEYYLFSKST
jgi:hypothetical protein